MGRKYLAVVTLIVGLAIGFFLGMEYKAYQVRSAFEKAFDTSSEPEKQSIVKESEKKESEIIEKRIGDEIELATLKFKVNRAEEKQILSSDYGTPEVAKEGAKFVAIDLNVTNTTDTKLTFYPDDGFRLVDNKGREFTTYPNTIGAVNNYLNVRDLSPSISENGVMVYEIPQDAKSYSIMTGKAGTSQIYKVVLK